MIRIDRKSAILAVWTASALWSCGDDRISSGTSGTQTGNALQARLLLTDGHPAAAAKVYARNSQAIDRNAPAAETTTDSDGRFLMRLPSGDWTLEAVSGAIALRMDIHLGSDTTLAPDTLAPCGALEGIIQGSTSGQSLSIAGLGRRVPISTDGHFRFDALPRGTHPLRLLGSAANWSVSIASARTDTLLLDASRSGEIFQALVSPVATTDRSRPSLLVQTVEGIALSSINALEWTDSSGAVLPAMPLDRNNDTKTVRAWVRPPSSGGISCRRIVSGTARRITPFAGYRLAMVFPAMNGSPDSVGTNSVLSYSDSSTFSGLGANTSFGFLPNEGWYRRSALGSPFAYLDSLRRPSGQSWSVSLRASLEYPEIGRIWLFDGSSLDGGGFKVGIGAGLLEVVGPGIDTTVPVSELGGFHDWTISVNHSVASVAMDDRVILESRSTFSSTVWTRCGIGIGGGIRISRLFVMDTL